MNKICCVYKIENIKSGYRYIGGTINYIHRRRQHLSNLSKNVHFSKHLQIDYNNEGKQFFVFSIIEMVSIEDLNTREEYWIKALNPEYNSSTKARGWDYIEETTKNKISAAVKKLWDDPEYREKHSKPRNWKNGVPNRKGAKLSDETKDKIRQANLGENNPNYGKTRSKESRLKMAKTYKGAISPDGIIYSPIINLREFCFIHALDNGSMSKVLNGKINAYKGWTRFTE
jgi:group I intron endonuclease